MKYVQRIGGLFVMTAMFFGGMICQQGLTQKQHVEIADGGKEISKQNPSLHPAVETGEWSLPQSGKLNNSLDHAALADADRLAGQGIGIF